MSMPSTSPITTCRMAMWNCINSADALKTAFRLQIKSDQQIAGFIGQGLAVSDYPAALIIQEPYGANPFDFGQEQLLIPFRVQLFYPENRWSESELRIVQVIWAIRNQTGTTSVPIIQAANCGHVANVSGVDVTSGTLQQAPSPANGINESSPIRCVIASAVITIAPLADAFG